MSMNNKNESINIFDSKIKKLRIELPHYSFSHSSSEVPSNAFVGRKKIQKKLKKLIEDSADKTGVYLVTGNRGVGKTSLVNQVVNQTSVQDNSNFSQNLNCFLIMLFSVVITQYCLQIFEIKKWFPSLLIFVILGVVSLFILWYYNGYRRNSLNKQHTLLAFFCFVSRECFFLVNQNNPYRKRVYLLKVILVACLTHIISIITAYAITPTMVFIFYSFFVFINMFRQFRKDKLHEYKIEGTRVSDIIILHDFF